MGWNPTGTRPAPLPRRVAVTALRCDTATAQRHFTRVTPAYASAT
jgi:hypothetical protein